MPIAYPTATASDFRADFQRTAKDPRLGLTFSIDQRAGSPHRTTACILLPDLASFDFLATLDPWLLPHIDQSKSDLLRELGHKILPQGPNQVSIAWSLFGPEPMRSRDR